MDKVKYLVNEVGSGVNSMDAKGEFPHTMEPLYHIIKNHAGGGNWRASYLTKVLTLSIKDCLGNHNIFNPA